jgi:hypothetical protein
MPFKKKIKYYPDFLLNIQILWCNLLSFFFNYLFVWHCNLWNKLLFYNIFNGKECIVILNSFYMWIDCVFVNILWSVVNS